MSGSKTINVKTEQNDSTPPDITIKNPSRSSISLYSGDPFNLRWKVIDHGGIKSINIYIDWRLIEWWITESDFVYPVSTQYITPWEYTMRVEAIDKSGNKSYKEFSLKVLER